MKALERFIIQADRNDGKAIYTADELRVLLERENSSTFRTALYAHVKRGLFTRISKGVFLYPYHTQKPDIVLGQTVHALRQGEFSFLSLESVLSECGAISQITFTKTFMTTGRSGIFDTPIGRIEFTHTKRPVKELFNHVTWNGAYYQATPQKALSDLKRVGRNVHLLDMECLNDV